MGIQQGKLQTPGVNLGSLEISDKDFSKFAQLIYTHTGIHITDKKRQLVISRLGKRLKATGLSSFSEYYDLLHSADQGPEEIGEFINQITTNKTDFFRENHHFEFIRSTVIPEILARGEKNLRFWSAGCSTGEEPYTLAITILDTLHQMKAGPGYDIKILATDLDTSVMQKTMAGVYEASKLEPVPPALKKRYFRQLSPTSYEVTPELRNIVRVARLNLMHPFPFKKGFNCIFCRNVLIYFTQEDRKKVVGKFRDHIRPNGYLFLGHSESLLADAVGYKNLGHTIYRRN